MKYCFFLFCFLFSFHLKALQVKARVDKNKLSLNESLVYTITIQSEEKPKNLDTPNLSQLNDFYLVGEWSGYKTSTTFINAQLSRSVSFEKSYRLQPKIAGTLRIDAFTVHANGKKFTTPSFFIIVKKSGKSPNSPPSSGGGSPPLNPFFPAPSTQFPGLFKDFFSQNDFHRGGVKLKARLNKKSVYKSEMIKLDWILLTSSRSASYIDFQIPELTGFWKEEGPKKQAVLLGTELIDKVLYQKRLLKSLWLFPLKTGGLDIDPYALKSCSSWFGNVWRGAYCFLCDSKGQCQTLA